jgi:hypothetical protein
MQVTELQVQRSIEALMTDAAGDGTSSAADPQAGGSADAHEVDVPAGLVEQLTESSSIRDDRLEGARRRLERGEQPSAEALAQRMVGRLVCDRLR